MDGHASSVARRASRNRLKVRQRLMVYLHPMSSADSRVSCDTTERSVFALLGDFVAAGLPVAVAMPCLSHQRVRLWCASRWPVTRPIAPATNLPQPRVCHARMQDMARIAERPACSRTRVGSTLPLFRVESFGVLLHSGCLVRSLGALRTCTETPVAFVAFCGCESDVLARPHRVSLCRVNSHADPLGAVPLWRF